jgi:hypothetical protein
MTSERPPMRAPWGDIAPRLTEIADRVLFDTSGSGPVSVHATAA